MKRTFTPVVVLFLVAFAGVPLVWAQHNQHSSGSHGAVNPSTDQRQFVRFPDALRDHTLANMRDHLLALQEIQLHLGMGRNDIAAKIAESRLGMASLVCMAQPRWPSICRKECRTPGRLCTVLPVGLRLQPKMQALPVMQSRCLRGWRTSQLSALAVTPDTVCNRSR